MPKATVVPKRSLVRHLPLLAAAFTPLVCAAMIAIYIGLVGGNLDLAKLPSSFRDLAALFGGIS